MILVGIGANLPAEHYESPLATCLAAINEFPKHGIAVRAASPWYRSAPVPMSEQPWYVNAVLEVETTRSPEDLMGKLHDVEAVFGRVRGERNAARVLDLDLLDFEGRTSAVDTWPVLPHPRVTERAFVLYPLRDIAPNWRLSDGSRTIDELIAALPPGQSLQAIPMSGVEQAAANLKSI